VKDLRCTAIGAISWIGVRFAIEETRAERYDSVTKGRVAFRTGTVRTDYESHDLKYRQFRAEGRLGWTDADDVREFTGHLEQTLRARYAPRAGRAIELGCGAGELALWLAGAGFEAYGVDVAPTAISWAQEKAVQRGLHADFRVGNVVDLSGFPDGFFDLAIDGLCLHCIIGSDRAPMLASVLRVLRPGGLFCVRTMCGDPSPASEMGGMFDSASRCLVVKDLAIRYLGVAERIVDEVRMAGFEVSTWSVHIRRNARDADDLLLDAVKPADS
jgi:SAM-dependent methyltransferase